MTEKLRQPPAHRTLRKPFRQPIAEPLFISYSVSAACQEKYEYIFQPFIPAWCKIATETDLCDSIKRPSPAGGGHGAIGGSLGLKTTQIA
jgi:hypothetical protein